MRVLFQNYVCIPEFGIYSNMRTAIRLLDAHNSQLIAVATINVAEEEIAKDEVCIKNYAENAGLLDALIIAGMIETPHRIITLRYPTHSIEIPVCKLLVTKEDL